VIFSFRNYSFSAVSRIDLGFVMSGSDMADLPATTTELEVYLTHLKCGGCDLGLEHVPCFSNLTVWSKGTKERIRWTPFMKGHFHDLEVISSFAYADYVACMLAQYGVVES
jgi:hypothetical protein